MNRRELIKSIVPLALTPMVVQGKEVGKVVKVDPQAKYLVFLSDRCGLDIEAFCRMESPLPIGTPVYMVRGEEIDDAIRIYKVDP